MLTNQSDEKNTLSLIGEYLAYYNLFRRKCDEKFGNIKKIPVELEMKTKSHRINRNKIAHELWEIINSDIYSLNNGNPNWIIKNKQLEKHIDDLIKICIELN